MSVDLVRSWRDEHYRESLPDDVRRVLPEPPDDLTLLTEDELLVAAGGSEWPPRAEWASFDDDDLRLEGGEPE